MFCNTYNINTFNNYKYVVVLSEYNGKILLSRHKNRTTWETQGGHIEKGETPIDAAKRELFEESGAVEFDLTPLCDYRAGDKETNDFANGVVFHGVIKTLGELPESEMAEVKEFDSLPENLTYSDITTELFTYLQAAADKIIC